MANLKNKTDKKIQLKSIQVDFSQIKTLEEYKEKIYHEVKDSDIGIVVLNAAVNFDGPFCELKNSELEGMVNVNCLGVMYTFRVL